MSSAASTTITINGVPTSRNRLAIVGDVNTRDNTETEASQLEAENVADHGERQWRYAAAYDPWVDPARFWAGNDDQWDYGRGNPVNPIHQGQDLSLRPNNTYTFIRFRGTHLMVVSCLEP